MLGRDASLSSGNKKKLEMVDKTKSGDSTRVTRSGLELGGV